MTPESKKKNFASTSEFFFLFAISNSWESGLSETEVKVDYWCEDFFNIDLKKGEKLAFFERAGI